MAKTERKVLEMTSVDKDGSTDEIAIDETRLLQSSKAFARRQNDDYTEIFRGRFKYYCV